MTSAPSLTDLLARVPELNEHTVAPPALAVLPDLRVLERVLRDILAQAPGDPRAYAALGNVLARRSLYFDARQAYLAAVARDEAFAQAHLAIAELSALLRDRMTAEAHLSRALSISRRYDDPLDVGGRRALLLLLRDATYAENAPIEMLVDRGKVAVHKLYIGAVPTQRPPAYDAVLCAFGPVSGVDDIATHVPAVIEEGALLNDPAAIAHCARQRLPETLGGCTGVTAVVTRLVPSDAIRSIGLPALVRPADTHGGFGLALIEDAAALAAHCARFPAPSYHVSPFVDYRSRDGYYRKYRIVIVGGRAYPYHLAISERWMVHYLSSPMRTHAWMQEEEAAFLADPVAAIPSWDRLEAALAGALQLDYVGIDLAVLPDGRVLVFEADPAMLIHDEDEHDVFAYKRPYVQQIRGAFERLAGLG